MRYSIFTICAILCLLSGCKNPYAEDKPGLGTFDISPDDKKIIYSYYNINYTGLYIANIDGTAIKSLKEDTNIFYTTPKWSPAGDKILYIKSRADTAVNTICIADSTGKKTIELHASNFITEACFSEDGKRIFFCQAKEYKNYSPIASAQPHGIDIYTIEIETKKIERITNFNAYQLGNVSCINNDTLLFELWGEERQKGIFFLDIKSKQLTQITSSSKGVSGIYYQPVYIKSENMIIYDGSYCLYALNLSNRSEKMIFSNIGKMLMGWLCPMKTQPKVLFTTENNPDLIYFMNTDGSDTSSVRIRVNNLTSSNSEKP